MGVAATCLTLAEEPQNRLRPMTIGSESTGDSRIDPWENLIADSDLLLCGMQPPCHVPGPPSLGPHRIVADSIDGMVVSNESLRCHVWNGDRTPHEDVEDPAALPNSSFAQANAEKPSANVPNGLEERNDDGSAKCFLLPVTFPEHKNHGGKTHCSNIAPKISSEPSGRT
eukprot:gnl/MRDRNA2_/MRDRNA2_192556_c0_seq1.p1 gnl/MRDRNA2_/MRDRNA2_192556_c0~~gnl/MRDRNA2_/MRDRNA2_192556_c0_seq1.p1  ORF type:complete len:170 (-),score=28.92 gnl/MRDRNA2_/MRDRNA2_192556_c0_seq1:251-760(-)